jgi:putative ABC transport system permease protein
LNESAAKAMAFKDPLGKIVKDGDREYHVVGVIKDFILQSPFQPMKPMVIEGAKAWFNVMHIKLNNKNDIAGSLKRAEAIFKKYNPQYPFEYQFIDEDYDAKFRSEQRTGTLAALFSGLTIFISCLGLFGLAAYMAESRIKEIGVRKVLGATVTSIATLLSKDFVGLVIIAFAAASPVAWWFMHNWLQNYPYRVTIEWWIFAFAALLSILIALITVSYHAIRAATANPVKSLRTE